MKKLSLDELGRHTIADHLQAAKMPVKVVLDNVRSGINVGSAFRTSDAFLVEEILFIGITPQHPHREILKAAIGAEASVRWQYFATPESCIAYLKNESCPIWVVEQTDSSVDLRVFDGDGLMPLALIFGNEVHGVSEAFLPVAAGAVEIPQFGTKHSLNISVSIGILLWDLLSRWRPIL